jgi:hypothetical protein
MTASVERTAHPDPRIGFLAHARLLSGRIATQSIPAAQVAALVLPIVIESARHGWLHALRRKEPSLNEAPMELSRITA